MITNHPISSKEKNKRPKKAFTPNEDKLIVTYVNFMGTKKWSMITKFIKSRTPKQCCDRYMNYLKPGLSNIEWTQNEDDLLIELFNKFGPKWSYLNKYFDNRNQVSLKNRILFLQKHCKNTDKFEILNYQKGKANDLKKHNITKKEKAINKYSLSDANSDQKFKLDDFKKTNEDSFFSFKNDDDDFTDDFSSISLYYGEDGF